MESSTSICRLCDSACEVDASRFPTQLVQSENDYISTGFNCAELDESIKELNPENRIVFPHQGSEQRTWAEANADIQKRLKAILKSHGSNSVGLYLGPDVFRRSSDWISAMSFAVSIGTSSIFTEQCLNDAARLFAIESMMGYATPLLSDVGRAHYVVLLGDDPHERGWGALQSGMSQGSKLDHSKNTKGTKMIVVSPRKNSFSDRADTHVTILPGTEVYFLLGLLSTMINSQWGDKQYIRDYTTGFEHLQPALKPWTTERCARLCGIEPAVLSGIALKYSRAAMAVIHPSPGTFSGPHADLAAWAWMAIHMVTANALRPGGIFENQGAIDLQPIYVQLHSENAPKTRVGDHSLLLMQAPATRVLDEITQEGDSQIKALIVIGEPLQRLPQSQKLAEAYQNLELLVHIDSAERMTSSHAHWVLPKTHSWEQEDIDIHRNTLMPYYAVGVAKPLQAPVGEAKSLSEILSALGKGLRRVSRSSAWGWHLRLAARAIAKGDIQGWTQKLCEFILDGQLVDGVNILGEIDRSAWRPVDDRLSFFPEPYPQLLSVLDGRELDASWPLLLCTDLDTPRRDKIETNTLKLTVHPDCGFKDGETVLLSTLHGAVEGLVCHNENQHPLAVICSSGRFPTILNVLNPSVCDRSGAVVLNGEPCRLETVRGA